MGSQSPVAAVVVLAFAGVAVVTWRILVRILFVVLIALLLYAAVAAAGEVGTVTDAPTLQASWVRVAGLDLPPRS